MNNHVVDDMLGEAAQAIEAMREAALNARRLHARAELMRHMRTTAAKMRARPLDEAAALVAGEWMKAWHIDGAVYAAIAEPVARFTRAFCVDANASTKTTQREIADAISDVEAALGSQGTSIADQMAWRSECAHGWWELVMPTPADLPHRAERAGMPRYQPGTPFWDAGCAPHCR
jgi:hypothetical protein